jgi:hypothetical protein
MTIHTAAGTKIYIGPAVTESTDTQGEYEALSYTEIGEVENLGEFGDTANIITFQNLGQRRVKKQKGSFDAGQISLTVGSDSADAGQAALVAAFAEDSEYAFKVVENDGSVGSPSAGTTSYFRAIVTSKPKNIGTVDNVVRRTFNIAISSELTEVAAV